MEEESFEDVQVANLINQEFIAIKVDKEERPDIDTIYMSVCQIATGRGGWPLSIIMTPEQKPFFAGTYIPKLSRYGMIGFIELLTEVSTKWKNGREDLLQSANEITSYLKKEDNELEKGTVSFDMLEQSRTMFSKLFDKEYGGFGQAPKFPTPHNLIFLLRYAKYKNDKEIINMVEKTLIQMYRGGIYDHIGFGFSRYSTDKRWLVPHFEKMLYDNTLLVMAFMETYQITKKDFYKQVADRILQYITRELAHEEGGFYCAQDADSEGVEGKYYVFTTDEIKQVLGAENGNEFNQYYDITENGNFEGKNIPNLLKNLNYEKPNTLIDNMSSKLYEYRLHRTKLHLDDKILTSWNALMIVAAAKSYIATEDENYITIAKNTVEFIEQKLSYKGNLLYVRYREKESAGYGHIDDYAFYIWALLEVYDATFELSYLEKAMNYLESMLNLFFDSENGGFYFYAEDSEKLIHKPKEVYDGAIPSGNAVAAYVLLKLARLTGKQKLQEIADLQLEFLAGKTKDYAMGNSFSLIAMLEVLTPSKEVVCVLKDKSELDTIKRKFYQTYKSNITILVKTEENRKQLQEIAEFTKDYDIKNDKTTFYVCENHLCSAPINDIDEVNI